MSNVRFIGCLHFGHEWMAKHRGFDTVFEHDQKIIDEWNKVVNKKDLTWILGDITMERTDHYYRLDLLNGRKKIVLGNHDLPEHTRELLKYVETVAGHVDYKGFALTHCPIHPNEIGFYKGNIHAHTHENDIEECIVSDKYKDSDAKRGPTLYKYYHVDAHRLDYRPRTIEELINEKLRTI